MTFIKLPDRQRSEDLGTIEICHIPVIWTADWKLMREATEYLIARGLGRWTPRHEGKSLYALSSKPSANSMYLYGRNLDHFLTYCERHNLNWRRVSYEQLLRTYQTDMLSGRASNSGNPLAAGTINNRVTTASDFLSYAASQGHRETFQISMEPTQKLRNGDNFRRYERRVGSVRMDPKDLHLPSRIEIKRWLDGLLSGYPGLLGTTAYCMCRTTVETAMRAEETILFRADQLPDPESIRPGTQAISVSIKYGTKGGRDPADPEKRGKTRSIRISRDWLVRLHDYKRTTRKLALRRYNSLHPGEPEPKELFLSPSTGRGYSYSRFRELWGQKGIKNRSVPFDGWTPHAGRHAWACYQLLDRIDAELEKLKSQMEIGDRSGYSPAIEWASSLGETLIKLHIQPFLGHVSPQTTELYLRWLVGQVQADRYLGEWSDWLDADQGGA